MSEISQNPRYEQTIRVITTLFAVILGFGLKHILDTTPKAKFQDLYIYKWRFYVVAILIIARLLPNSANHLWLEYAKYRMHYSYPNFVVETDLLWLTAFGGFGVAICYMNTSNEFFTHTLRFFVAPAAWSIWGRL